ncbi:hypothetical protein NP493_1288g01036 [Ridgeia piscesae]|uniref:Uncharacterized protein n=1 Tax=Ridgeia piscesae TaxID=27915 RepID=A0AAD9K952_RIDPI|nr:hypothetical protein NP493_1288g01036 [Ridgeia piscesae]
MRKMKNVIVSCMSRIPSANVGAFSEPLENILSDIKSKRLCIHVDISTLIY